MSILFQVERLAAGDVASNQNVIFDTTLVSTGNISYNNATGVITIEEAGRYEVDWWVATQSSTSTMGAGFALVSSQGDTIIGNSPIKTGEVVGIGVIEVATAPVTLELRNNSGAPVYYGGIVPVKASLAITHAAEGVAYGGLYNDTTQIIVIAPNATEPIALDEVMPSNNTTPGVSTLTVDVAGDYSVEFFILLQSTTGSFGILAGVQINGAFSAPQLFTSTVLTADFAAITVSGIATLAEGDVLSLAISSATGGTVLFGPDLHANLSAIRLGD